MVYTFVAIDPLVLTQIQQEEKQPSHSIFSLSCAHTTNYMRSFLPHIIALLISHSRYFFLETKKKLTKNWLYFEKT